MAAAWLQMVRTGVLYLLGSEATAPGQQAKQVIERERESVLSSLRALATRYQQINLNNFTDGKDELLRLQLAGLDSAIPESLRTDVYFRESYAGILAIARAGNYKEAAIFKGTPGVGKSTVAMVLACDAASRGLRVVHRSCDAFVGEILVYMDFRSTGKAIVDYAHSRQGEHYKRLGAYLGASDILLIWDGRLNKGQYGGRRGCFVLASSNEDNYSSFKKGGVPVYYIDTWRPHEILKALPLYPHVTREQAVKRYYEFGGTVRDVLANAHVAGQTFKAQVADAVSGEDADCLCNLRWMATSSTVVRHRWAHMRSEPDMLSCKYTIASPAIRKLLFKVNVDQKKRTVRQLVLSAAAGERAFAGFRGYMLEEFGHEILPGALKVKLKPCRRPTTAEAIAAAQAASDAAVTLVDARAAALEAQDLGQVSAATAAIKRLRRSKRRRPSAPTEQGEEEEGMVEEEEGGMLDHHLMPPPEAAPVAEADVQQQLDGMEQEVLLTKVSRVWDYPGLDISCMDAYYLQPTTPNNAGWDAVRKSPEHLYILQYTVSEWHGTKAQSILDLLARLSSADRARAVMVYAVPPDVYPQYLQQPWLAVGKKRMARVPAELGRLPQMVLCMPLGDEGSRGSSGDGTS